MSCDEVMEEARTIVKVCLEIQEDLDPVEREEVFKLLALVEAKSVCCTAGNYFVLNRSCLFSILSVVTTYFIILVQFHQKY